MGRTTRGYRCSMLLGSTFGNDLHHDRAYGERARQEATSVVRTGFITRLREEELATVFTTSATLRVQASDASLFDDRTRRLSCAVLIRCLRQICFRGLLLRVGQRRKDSVIT